MNPLERCDVELIVAALNHYKFHVRSTDYYPSYEFRQEQLDRIDETLGRFLTIARGLLVDLTDDVVGQHPQHPHT